jgi:REP element-mobilizing transposase RayT
LIVGYHIIFGAYGFWLPNDPRGSFSTFVGLKTLFHFAGPATTTSSSRSLAHQPHDAVKRRAAKKLLPHRPVRWNAIQIRVVGRGFANYLKTHDCTIWACAVMRDHVHLVVGRLPMSAERFVIQLKEAAVKELLARECHPFQNERDAKGKLPKSFVRGQWIAYLEPGDVGRSIEYVEKNPAQQGLPSQRWSFVTSVTR